MAEVVEHLPSHHIALSANPSTTKKKKNAAPKAWLNYSVTHVLRFFQVPKLDQVLRNRNV
jgi:hypothetical protein